jgi:hypothetical protein
MMWWRNPDGGYIRGGTGKILLRVILVHRGDQGVQINQMEKLATLAVRARNTVYEIAVLNGHTGEVLVRGGEFFPERMAVRLEGSSFGGSILKWRGIYVGLRMEIVPEPVEMVSKTVLDPETGQKEFLLGHRAILTSPVQSIEVL